jgi:hypothetical protein
MIPTTPAEAAPVILIAAPEGVAELEAAAREAEAPLEVEERAPEADEADPDEDADAEDAEADPEAEEADAEAEAKGSVTLPEPEASSVTAAWLLAALTYQGRPIASACSSALSKRVLMTTHDVEDVPTVRDHGSVVVGEDLDRLCAALVLKDHETRGLGSSQPLGHLSVDGLRSVFRVGTNGPV